MSFDDFSINDEILSQIKILGWESPTDIQKLSIPVALKGKDIIGIAETGSGKTAAFCIPILNHWIEQNKPTMYSLIFAPTRELCLQIESNLNSLGENLGLKILRLIGGESVIDQVTALGKFDSHIIVATPGRIVSMLDQTKKIEVMFGKIQQLVVDEADKMLNMECFEDIKKIVQLIPEKPSKKNEYTDMTRQTQLFSATYGKEAKHIFGFLLSDPIRVSSKYSTSFPKTLKHYMLYMNSADKAMYLYEILMDYLYKDKDVASVLVFVKDCNDSFFFSTFLNEAGINAAPLNSKLEKEERIENLKRFREGNISVLVATNIASRGIDVDHISLVVCLDVAENTDTYKHRVGRTARVGRPGTAITFVYPESKNEFNALERKLNIGRIESYEKLTTRLELTVKAWNMVNEIFSKVKKEDIKRRRAQYEKEQDKADHLWYYSVLPKKKRKRN